MIVSAAVKVERFFRAAAGLGVDESELKRYSDFIDQKLYDLRLRPPDHEGFAGEH